MQQELPADQSYPHVRMIFSEITSVENILLDHSLFHFRQRFLTVRPAAANVILNETFEEKNARLKRPLSPHLSIYKPQITMVMSISHRISGVILFGYMFALAGCNISHYNLLLNGNGYLAMKTNNVF